MIEVETVAVNDAVNFALRVSSVRVRERERERERVCVSSNQWRN